ncbi:nucleotidyltransferase family protein [Novosphingobium sp. KACC 22771]|uniref:nucleotidyltransferase family protein n=1 Tax=Novosphingobium sp. KACC 22771 TaxID=3025670 RepID=UPI0023655ECC|nr:nucleotidyltransferase family protein [Novosphingobium sp. KACC 22771]WDF73569.1 nucleotidyltransferase family protein [Novosphingobium sp. KACC 22771]
MKPLVSDTAMVLSAGLGKRMRPLTATRPKPMVPVAGRPLIDHALDKLVDAGVAKAVVNVHYMADYLLAHMGKWQKPVVTISDERAMLLETGGGMVKAYQDGLLPDPFFALNSDNVWLDGPVDVFHDLSSAWDAERMDALLLMVRHSDASNYRGMGDFSLDPLGRVSRRASRKVAPFIFTGIQIVSHRLLRDAPQGAFSTNILWDRAMEEGRLYGLVHTGKWFEVGTPQSIAPTEEALNRV